MLTSGFAVPPLRRIGRAALSGPDAPGMAGSARREAEAGRVPASSEVLSGQAGERRPSEERSDDSLGRRERCAPGRPGAGGTIGRSANRIPRTERPEEELSC